MIISHRHRFVFLHIPKTAGSALRHRLRALDPESESSWDWAWSADRSRYVDQAHVPMRDLEASAYHRRLLREYFTFAVIRHPYERFVSGVLEHLKQREIAVTAQSVREVVENLDPFRVRFDARFIHLCPMHEFTHLGVRRRFDHLLRFERLEEDLAEMCALLGLDAGRLLPLDRLNVGQSEQRDLAMEALGTSDLQARIAAFYEFDWRLFSAYYPATSGNAGLVARAEALAGLSPPARWRADQEAAFLPSLAPLADTISRTVASEARASGLAVDLEREHRRCAELEAVAADEHRRHGQTQAALQAEQQARAALEAALDLERRDRMVLEARLQALEAKRAASPIPPPWASSSSPTSK